MYKEYYQDSPKKQNWKSFHSSPSKQTPYVNNLNQYHHYITKNSYNDFVSNAAPFPKLPKYTVVQELESVVKSELKRYQLDLQNKKRQLYNCFADTKVTNPYDINSLGVITYRGFYINHFLIDNIERENRSKIKKSCEKANIQTDFDTTTQSLFYLRVSMLCRQLIESAPYMFTVIFKRMQLQQEKLYLLTLKYVELRDVWTQLCNYVDCLNIRTHKKLGEWGIEQILAPTAYDEGGQAPDVPMHIDHDFQSIMLYDTNRFVKDPELEHNQFKKRIVWLPFEVKLFYDKFFMYPKKFGKISKCFPDKTTKDVIEFYYSHRYTTEMKQVITRLKHRGKMSNNKVASEGQVKKK